MTQTSMIVRVAADSWNGDPAFTVSLDGQRIGGIFTASASHASGAWEDIMLTGDLATVPSTVTLSFINDGYGGWGDDRNLYVQSLTIGGRTFSASQAADAAGTIAGGVASLLTNGSLTFNTATATAIGSLGGVPTKPVAVAATGVQPPASVAMRSLTLRVAADAYLGNPNFIVTVDGKQVGGTYAATASHAAGQWQDVTVTGPFAADPSHVAVSFVNDAWGGSGSKDRNLYVQSLIIDGQTLAASSVTGTGNVVSRGVADLLSNGTATFDTSILAAAKPPVAPPSSTPSGTNTLTIRVSEDAWQGDAQFTVTVDGKQVGGTYTTNASHAAGAWQDVTVTGDFAAKPSSVAISFVNDAYGGWGLDRNLYVQSLTIAGRTFSAANTTDTGGSTTSGVAQLLSNGKVTFDTSSLSSAAPPSEDHGLQLLGVNLAGAEFGSDKEPGTYGTDYTYPTHQEIDYYASKGLNVIRVPFLWERMQNTLDGPLNTSELARMTDVVNYAASKGMKTILDPHDYATYDNNAIGSAATPDSAFADFWGKLSASFASNSHVIFGLMNEPHLQTASAWLGAANDAIAAIRSSGAHQEILVPGTNWDGAWTWTSSDNASVVGTGVKDPDANYAFEVHQYLDSDGSGTKSGVSADSVGVDRLTSITNWAESHNAKLFLGEFGVSSDTQSLNAADKMLTYMGQHADVWQGATYWAGGPWWWGSNIYGVEPNGLGTAKVQDQPQMAVLTHHIASA